jgi:hypothetical protein
MHDAPHLNEIASLPSDRESSIDPMRIVHNQSARSGDGNRVGRHIPRTSVNAMNAIHTRPQGCDDWSIVETLFGPRGACGGCWCMRRVPMGGRTWEAAKGEPNRKAFRKLVALVAAAVELAPERGATEVEEYPQSMAPGGAAGRGVGLDRRRLAL